MRDSKAGKGGREIPVLFDVVIIILVLAAGLIEAYLHWIEILQLVTTFEKNIEETIPSYVNEPVANEKKAIDLPAFVSEFLGGLGVAIVIAIVAPIVDIFIHVVWRICNSMLFVIRIEYFRRQNPKGDRMLIYVADIRGDNDAGCIRDDIIDSLLDILGSKVVQVLGTDFEIASDHSEIGYRTDGDADEKARKFLKARDGDLLIWGRVTEMSENRAVRLHFVVPQPQTFATQPPFDPPAFEFKTSDLKNKFAPEVGVTLAAQAAIGLAFAKGGSAVIDTMRNLAKRLEAMVDEVGQDRAVEDQWQLNSSYALLLQAIGSQAGEPANLEISLGLYRKMLPQMEEKAAWREWSISQNNIGAALQELGAGEPGTERLCEARQCYQAVLAKLDELKPVKQDSLEWIAAARQTTLIHLGAVLKSMGEREENPAFLVQGLQYLDQVLKSPAENTSPEDIADLQVNRGNLLRLCGEIESNPDRLSEAELAYQKALAIRTREQAPLAWAVTQSYLANVLQTRGRLERSEVLLERAVDAYREALEVQTKDGTPVDWGITQNNLADALVELGRLTGSTKPLEQAIEAYGAAATVRKEKLDGAYTQDGWSSALDALATCTRDNKYRQEAITRLESAIGVYEQSGAENYYLTAARQRLGEMAKSLATTMADAAN